MRFMANAMSFIRCKGVMASTVLALLAVPAHAAVLSVTVVGTDGKGVPGAVVVAETRQGYPAARTGVTASMDQRDLMFVPEVLVVRTGTSVNFPNSDEVRHQVYSFSLAKVFQLALYEGRAHPPVVFDRAGIVTLGCNIHDGMIGYIYVTESPWYGRTDSHGALQLKDIPDGLYTIKVWHPRLAEPTPQLEQSISLDKAQSNGLRFQLKKPLRSTTYQHGTDKQWQSY